jgi:hypothetical protein
VSREDSRVASLAEKVDEDLVVVLLVLLFFKTRKTKKMGT